MTTSSSTDFAFALELNLKGSSLQKRKIAASYYLMWKEWNVDKNRLMRPCSRVMNDNTLCNERGGEG
eukprot:scaffold20874_cov115-Skeletonema_dohrnii-CCMP3373.AAC.1